MQRGVSGRPAVRPGGELTSVQADEITQFQGAHGYFYVRSGLQMSKPETKRRVRGTYGNLLPFS